MGEQILLLKIELDPSIASIYNHQIIPRFAMDLGPDPPQNGKDLMYNTHIQQVYGQGGQLRGRQLHRHPRHPGVPREP